MRRPTLLVICLGLSVAISAGAQLSDFGTWDMSESEKARDMGVGSLSVTRDGLSSQSRDQWTVQVELLDLEGLPLGSMEFRWPTEKSSDLRWTKPFGETLVLRTESEGPPSMELEDVSTGELVRWDWLCDMEALMNSHKTSGFESQEEMDAVMEESRRCGREVAVTGTDMEFQEALDHYEPVWQFFNFIETAVRTRMGFSRLQLLRKEQREEEDARRRSQQGADNFEFCPPPDEEICPIPNPPADLQVLGEGYAGFGEDPRLRCCLDAWDDADDECKQRTFRDCCAVNTCVVTNFGCPPLCWCQRIGAMWGCHCPS